MRISYKFLKELCGEAKILRRVKKSRTSNICAPSLERSTQSDAWKENTNKNIYKKKTYLKNHLKELVEKIT